MNEEIRPEKFATKFVLELDGDMVLPKRFGLVSAFNKDGQPLANWQADRALFVVLREAGYMPFRMVAISDDGKTAQPGFGFYAPDTKAVAEVAKRYAQDHFYWVSDGKLQIRDFQLRASDHLGSFDEYLV